VFKLDDKYATEQSIIKGYSLWSDIARALDSDINITSNSSNSSGRTQRLSIQYDSSFDYLYPAFQSGGEVVHESGKRTPHRGEDFSVEDIIMEFDS
jgi:hypothetical protein